ncbi:MAG: PhzF family phenazine biosynthesis protein [Planctomycetota bacterium]
MPTAPPPLYIIDAFADRPFTGNPAAVCLLDRNASVAGWPDPAWMQQLAGEMNLSETAFVLPPAEANEPFGLRWFTPEAEVELCGHATLASAHVLFEESQRPGETIDFQTRYAGVLSCRRAAGPTGDIAMDFPAQRNRPVATPPGLLEALRVEAAWLVPGTGTTGVHFGPYDFFVQLDTPDRVVELQPDFAALAAFECRGVAVTAAVPHDHPRAKSTQPGGFRDAAIVSRFFAPRHRIAEDPVTGSLHCVLATFWAERLGQPNFTAYQASARGGLIQVNLHEPQSPENTRAASGGGEGRVTLAGRAVTVMRGRLADPPPAYPLP